MEDGSVVDRHDCLLLGEGCNGLSPWVALGLPALGESSRGHVVFNHGAIFDLVPDGVCMLWGGHLEKLLRVISRLQCLVLEIALSGSDVFLIGVVVIVVAASSNCDPLGASLWSLLTTLVTPLSTFAGSLGWCPSAIARDCLLVALDEDGPDHLFTRGVLGDNVKELLCGLRTIIPR
jgi:hypothetical protein